MHTLLIVLLILASTLLAFIVLIQNPKGGGLAAGFSGGTNFIGVKRTGDLLEKGTWGLIIAIILISMIMNILPAGSGAVGSGGRSQQITPTGPASSMPMVPTETAPAEETVISGDTAQ